MCGAIPESDASPSGVPAEMPSTSEAEWKPRWLIDLGNGDRLGVTVDDGCFVVLYSHDATWRPGTRIPKEAAAQIAKLVNAGTLD